MYCEVCKITCNGEKNFQQHLESAKHKKKLQLMPLIEQQKDSNEFVTLNCAVCKITCTGEKNFQQHLESAKHKKKLQQKLLIQQNIDSNGTSSNFNSSNSDNSILCVHCVRVFNTILDYQKHSGSIEHALMILKNKSDSIKLSQPANEISQMDSSVSSEPCGRKHCEPCNKDFTGREPYEQHIKSGKHKRKFSQLSDKKLEPNNGDAHRKKMRLSNAQQKVTLYFCKECKVSCTGHAQYEQHNKGKKHIKNVAAITKLKKDNSSQYLKATATGEPSIKCKQSIKVATPKNLEDSNSSLDSSNKSTLFSDSKNFAVLKLSDLKLKYFKAYESIDFDKKVHNYLEDYQSQGPKDELNKNDKRDDEKVRDGEEDEHKLNQTLSSPTSSDAKKNQSQGLEDELDEDDERDDEEIRDEEDDEHKLYQTLSSPTSADPKKNQSQGLEDELDEEEDEDSLYQTFGLPASSDQESDNLTEECSSDGMQDELDEEEDENLLYQTFGLPASSDQESDNGIEECSSDGMQYELDDDDDQ